MAKGHTIPLHLVAALSACGLRVTLDTTLANSPFISRHLPSCHHPSIDILTLPFPHLHLLPPGVESTDVLPSMDRHPTFLRAMSLLRRPFHHLLVRLLGGAARPTLCLISDFFLDWTLSLPSLGPPLPRLPRHVRLLYSLCKSLWVHQPHSTSADHRLPFYVPGTPPSLLTLMEVPDIVHDAANPDDPVTQYLNELGDSDVSSWGIVVNSFVDVDGDCIRLLELFYHGGACVWILGPLSLFANLESAVHGCLKWLDGKDWSSMVYISFGTHRRYDFVGFDKCL